MVRPLKLDEASKRGAAALVPALARVAGAVVRRAHTWCAVATEVFYTLIDLAELPEAMRRAGRPGPKPKRER